MPYFRASEAGLTGSGSENYYGVVLAEDVFGRATRLEIQHAIEFEPEDVARGWDTYYLGNEVGVYCGGVASWGMEGPASYEYDGCCPTDQRGGRLSNFSAPSWAAERRGWVFEFAANTVGLATSLTENYETLVLAEHDRGVGPRLEIQRALTFEAQGVARGWDTYCLVNELAARTMEA